jgi:ketosteroid isomerase-like protein
MSEENVEAVRALYAAMNVQDVGAAAEILHPDVEWISDPRVGDGPVRGREEVVEFFTERASMFGEIEVEVERLWDAGDRVLAFLRIAGSGSASGAEFEIRIAHLWTLAGGKVVSGRGFGNRDEALEAAGVSAANAETVRRAIGLWGRRDFDALAKLAHPEFVLDLSRNLDAAVYSGVDGLRDWTEHVGETWDDFRFRTGELTEVGEHVVTEVEMSGKGRGSGAETRMTVFQIWRFRDGKIVRVVGGLRDRAAAIEAAAAE